MRHPIAMLFTAALIAISACASEPQRPPVAPPSPATHVSPGAPVRVSGSAGAGSASVQVEFLAAGSDVSVSVWGVDGLRVTSPGRPVEGASFPAGGGTTLAVTYEAPAGQSNLAVKVQGNFGGMVAGRVASFTVGSPSPEQRQQAQKGLATDAQGTQVRVVPAERVP
jgi:hypothetical protein